MNRYFLFYKPYGVLSQFSREAKHPTLSDYGPFPGTVYSAGRLDADSEGLLLLTDDNEVKQRLTDPRFAHPRTYLVQVERIPEAATLQRLRIGGVVLDGKKTNEAEIRLLKHEPDIPQRPVPIRFRKNVPTSWLEMTLREGRNRQVRRMTAAIGHPTLRLIRVQIGPLTLSGLRPGESRELTLEEEGMLRERLGLVRKNR
jgi:pseudouridine synthase